MNTLLHMPRRKRPTSDFGPRLRRLRVERGWTQEELGKRIRASQRVITYYETDGKYPPAPALADLAAALGVTMEALMGRDDIPEPGHHSAGLNLLNDPDDRRLWKKFRQLRQLSDRDQLYLFKTLSMLAEAKGNERSTG